MLLRQLRAAVGLPHRFWCDRGGVTAIEFGLISAPLFGLIFAIMQSALAFFMQQGLRAALDVAARQVMTGEAANNSNIVDGASFRDQLICAKGYLPSIMTCSKIVVDVRSASSFSSLGPSDVNSSFMTSGAQYSAGQPCEIMIVRAGYPMPSYVPMITWGPSFQLLTNLTGLTTYNGQLVQMLIAASVFRNEPYVAPSGGASSCS
jgi:Flp pilus assembly protein TadG